MTCLCPLGFPPPAFCDAAAITITASNVNLDGGGFTLSGAISTGVGIRITADHVHVHDIAVEQFNTGMEITGGGFHHLNGVTLQRNSIAQCNGGVGLLMTNTNHNSVNNSTISANERWGIRLVSSNGNRFHGNEIARNSFRPGMTSGNIDLSSSNFNQINGNDLSRGGLFGVRSENSHRNFIVSNVIDESGTPAGIGVGILLSSSAGNIVQGNHLDRVPAPNMHYRGIVLMDNAMYNILRSNTVRNHPGSGIVLSETATRNLILANHAFQNTPWDAEDDNPDCDANIWKANRFGTANQSCIE